MRVLDVEALTRMLVGEEVASTASDSLMQIGFTIRMVRLVISIWVQASVVPLKWAKKSPANVCCMLRAQVKFGICDHGFFLRRFGAMLCDIA